MNTLAIFLLISFATLNAAKSPVPAPNTSALNVAKMLVDLLQGFCDGFGVKENMEKFSDCLQNKEQVWENIKRDAYLLSDLSYLFEHFTETMTSLVDSVIRLARDLVPCVEGVSFVTTITDLIIAINPAKLFSQATKAVIAKNSALLANIRNMYDALIKDDAYLLGKNLGEFLSAILVSK